MKFWSSNKRSNIIEKWRGTFLHSMTFEWKPSMDNMDKAVAVKEKTQKLWQLIKKMLFLTQLFMTKDWHGIKHNAVLFSI